MSFLVTGVFGDEVEVFAADDEGAVHFGGDDGAGEDTAADRDETCEGAFLVYPRERGRHVLVDGRPSQSHAGNRSTQPRIGSVPEGASSPRTQRTDVGSINGRLRRPEAQPNILVPSPAALANSLALGALILGVEEDVGLLLEGSLRLHGEFGRHGCG